MTVFLGECAEVMRAELADSSVDAVVTDPPYAIGILGREWDKMPPAEFEAWCQEWAAECWRVLKPGGYLAAFGSPRTYHRLAAGIEDAGFVIRDTIAWLHTQGYPASMDVSASVAAFRSGAGAGEDDGEVDRTDVLTVTRFLKAARDAAGWTNAQIDQLFGTNGMAGHWTSQGSQPAVPRIEQWDRLRSELSFDDTQIRQLVEDLAAVRVWTPGTGAPKARMFESLHDNAPSLMTGQDYGTRLKPAFEPITLAQKPPRGTLSGNIRVHGTGALHLASEGKFPANVTVGEGVEVTGIDNPGEFWPVFRYTPKPSAEERVEVGGVVHPTVKPLALIRWLVDLVTPEGGVVLDPFAGSGTTGVAAIAEGRVPVLIEKQPEFMAIIEHRLGQPIQQTLLGGAA